MKKYFFGSEIVLLLIFDFFLSTKKGLLPDEIILSIFIVTFLMLIESVAIFSINIYYSVFPEKNEDFIVLFGGADKKGFLKEVLLPNIIKPLIIFVFVVLSIKMVYLA
jgi:hypothetical protein